MKLASDRSTTDNPADAHATRLKAALRANLLRRKQQHNARQQQDPTTTTPQQEEGADVNPS